MLLAIALHSIFGAGFAAIGIFARQLCEHLWHKLAVGAALILLESAVMVTAVG